MGLTWSDTEAADSLLVGSACLLEPGLPEEEDDVEVDVDVRPVPIQEVGKR